MIFRSGTARGVPFFAFESLATRPDSCSRVVTRREAAIETALKAKLEQRRVEREQAQSANRAEIEAFTAEFLNAARECFLMIDKDNSGTLVKAEMSARSVRPSTRARRGSHAIDATRCLPRDPPAASRP